MLKVFFPSDVCTFHHLLLRGTLKAFCFKLCYIAIQNIFFKSNLVTEGHNLNYSIQFRKWVPVLLAMVMFVYSNYGNL